MPELINTVTNPDSRSNVKRHTRLAASALPLLILFGAYTPRTTSLERLAWLAGCWEMREGTQLIEEQWMAPGGQVMLGMSRTTNAGVTVGFEQMLIREANAGIFLRASPSGQPTAEFAALEVTDSTAVFSEPAHDFPQRIAYRTAARGDSLLAVIAGTLHGEPREVAFGYARVSCKGD